MSGNNVSGIEISSRLINKTIWKLYCW